MHVIYRILSFIVSFFCAFLAMNVLFGILYALAEPMALLICFIFTAVVLYGWFANRFFATVIIKKATMTRRQKDWLQVNAIVALIFSLLCVIGGLQVYADPTIANEALKTFPEGANISVQQVMTALNVFFGLSLALLIHIVWTYILVRKNKAAFIE